jgi:hypothetical protein
MPIYKKIFGVSKVRDKDTTRPPQKVIPQYFQRREKKRLKGS